MSCASVVRGLKCRETWKRMLLAPVISSGEASVFKNRGTRKIHDGAKSFHVIHGKVDGNWFLVRKM